VIVFAQSILAFLIVLVPLVLIHEFGHFIVAKMLGIGVPVFSIGFGPRLFGIRRGGTDYRVSAIPLGGYVRLQGDEADEHRCGAPEEFLTRPKWQRFLVFVAGATFNVFLAVGVLWLLFGVYGKQEVQNPEAYPVLMGLAEDSAAKNAGLLRGDVILEIAGLDVKGSSVFRDVYNREIVLSPNTVKTLLVERDGRRIDVEMAVGADEKFGHGSDPGWYLSWGGDETPVILDVSPGERAEEAGLLAGDRVIGVGESSPITELALRRLLEASAEVELAVRIDRDGTEQTILLTPRLQNDKGRIGAVIGLPLVQVDLNVAQALNESLRENLANSAMLFEVLKRMVTREVPLKSVSGPIGIAQYARQALITSPKNVLWLLAFFSLQLGILNLLPIPVLDGGHILILGVEGLTRRDLSERLKERVMQLGFVFLLAFMGVVIFMDISKL
jgi:regulator of sigma E protease